MNDQQAAPITQERRSAMIRAATSCPHSIDADSVELFFDPKQEGHNALAQLANRLEAAALSLPTSEGAPQEAAAEPDCGGCAEATKDDHCGDCPRFSPTAGAAVPQGEPPHVPETLTCTCQAYPHTSWCYPLASALYLGAPITTPELLAASPVGLTQDTSAQKGDA
jgi:hypothetical protein